MPNQWEVAASAVFIPGSLPSQDRGRRNDLPDFRPYRWRGQDVPVAPYVDRPDTAPGRPVSSWDKVHAPKVRPRDARCPKCECCVRSKKHRRMCLGEDVPVSRGNR